jgi:hypothetical protein
VLTPFAPPRTRARGPLAAFADILIDLQVPPGEPLTRRRQFHGLARYPGTLQYVAAELNPAATDHNGAGGRAAGRCPYR